MNKEALEYFNGDELATSVWLSKYAAEGEKTPADMHRRMAKEFAKIESDYIEREKQLESRFKHLSTYGQTRENLTEDKLFQLFDKFNHIIPQGSVMASLGSKEITSLSNCFVIGSPEDSYGGILRKDEELVQLMKRRGGVGIDMSTLRPSTTPVTNSAKTSTGAVSFMNRYSESTREVAQDGRRGALMISIDVNHPDVLEFIKIKRDRTSITGANISVKLNDKFMRAVENDEDYFLRWPVDLNLDGLVLKNREEMKEFPYNELVDTGGGLYVKKVKAKEYWDEIIKSARDHAEPGLMFWDRMVNYSPDGVYPQFKQVTSNPCSEIAMQPYDACRLIAINLYGSVKEPFTKKAYFDYKAFYDIAYETMRISDDLIDLEIKAIDRILSKIDADPESYDIKRVEYEMWQKIRETAKQSRRTGAGVTGLGDVLAALGVAYDSDEAAEIKGLIMKTKKEAELDCSIDLAILRGPFPGYDVEKEFTHSDDGTLGNNDWYQFILDEFPAQANAMMKHGRRNLSFSTIAPTGSVSILAQVTSGLEPLFLPFYTRRKKINNTEDRVDFVDELGDKWTEYGILHPKFKVWVDVNFFNLKLPTELAEQFLQDIETWNNEMLQIVFEQSPWYGSTANDIDWIKRVKTQSILQKYVTHSISSTINLPEDVTNAQVSEIYLESWKQGLKGVTVYREGSRSGVMVAETEQKSAELIEERPEEVHCKVLRFRNERKKWIAFIGTINGHPYEVFTGINDLDEFPVPTHVEEGVIIKVPGGGEEGKSRYDFRYTDQYGYVNTLGGLNRVFNKEFWNYARLTSLLLRKGIPLLEVIDNIEKMEFSNRSLNSWQAGIIRSLKSFIADGTKYGENCPACGEDQVIYENGCTICKNCGDTSCG